MDFVRPGKGRGGRWIFCGVSLCFLARPRRRGRFDGLWWPVVGGLPASHLVGIGVPAGHDALALRAVRGRLGTIRIGLGKQAPRCLQATQLQGTGHGGMGGERHRNSQKHGSRYCEDPAECSRSYGQFFLPQWGALTRRLGRQYGPLANGGPCALVAPGRRQKLPIGAFKRIFSAEVAASFASAGMGGHNA